MIKFTKNELSRLGVIAKTKRVERKLSGEKLANEVGMNKSSVYLIEKGDLVLNKEKVIGKVFNYLGMDLKEEYERIQEKNYNIGEKVTTTFEGFEVEGVIIETQNFFKNGFVILVEEDNGLFGKDAKFKKIFVKKSDVREIKEAEENNG